LQLLRCNLILRNSFNLCIHKLRTEILRNLKQFGIIRSVQSVFCGHLPDWELFLTIFIFFLSLACKQALRRCGRSKADKQNRDRCVSERSRPVRGSLRSPTLTSFGDGFARATNEETLAARRLLMLLKP